MSDRIGVVASQYPALSHTFIRREIAALRRAGLEVLPFSIRRTPPEQLLTAADRDEAQRTTSVLPASPFSLAADHVWAAGRAPLRYLHTLARALAQRPPGLRSLLWASFYFAEAIRLARLLDRAGVAHLHTHFANAGADVSALAAAYLELPWSLMLHGTCDFEPPASHTLGDKIHQARFVACASHFVRAQAMRAVPADHWHELAIVRCGLDAEALSGAPAARSTERPLRILCVARLSTEKGIAGLLEAYAEAASRGLAGELRIAGDGPERAGLVARAQALGLGERCRFLGPLAFEEVQQEYRAAHLFVLPSLMEGLPVVLMEAMAAGLPVIAPSVGGIPELVEPGETGLLFAAGDWPALAAAIARLAQDRPLADRLAEAGRARVVAQHDVERCAATLAAWLRR